MIIKKLISKNKLLFVEIIDEKQLIEMSIEIGKRIADFVVMSYQTGDSDLDKFISILKQSVSLGTVVLSLECKKENVFSFGIFGEHHVVSYFISS